MKAELIKAIRSLLVSSDRAMTAGEIMHELKARGEYPSNGTKKAINQTLYQVLEAKQLVRRVGESRPLWKSTDTERTSYNDLRELASKYEYELAHETGQVPLKDGIRYRASFVCNGIEATSCKPFRRKDDAIVRAAHEMLDLLSKAKSIPLLQRKEARACYVAALNRGIDYARFAIYPAEESTFLEFKGRADGSESAYSIKRARKLIEKEKSFFVAALNALILNQDIVECATLVVGVNDKTREMHGICATRDEVNEYKSDKAFLLHQEKEFKVTTLQFLSAKLLESSESQAYSLDKALKVDCHKLRGDTQDLYFLVSIRLYFEEMAVPAEPIIYKGEVPYRDGARCAKVKVCNGAKVERNVSTQTSALNTTRRRRQSV